MTKPAAYETVTALLHADDIAALIAGSVPNVILVDHSIAAATGASQAVLAAKADRRALTLINPLSSTTDWTIDPLGGVAAVGTLPGFVLQPGDSWSPTPPPANAISGIGVAAAKLIVLEG